jgi:hypothetical protein
VDLSGRDRRVRGGLHLSPEGSALSSNDEGGCRGIVKFERSTWGTGMTYRIIYREMPGWRDRDPAETEEYGHESQALGRARELIECGEHHGVAVDDGSGNLLHGVRLQLKLGGFSGD